MQLKQIYTLVWHNIHTHILILHSNPIKQTAYSKTKRKHESHIFSQFQQFLSIMSIVKNRCPPEYSSQVMSNVVPLALITIIISSSCHVRGSLPLCTQPAADRSCKVFEELHVDFTAPSRKKSLKITGCESYNLSRILSPDVAVCPHGENNYKR